MSDEDMARYIKELADHHIQRGLRALKAEEAALARDTQADAAIDQAIPTDVTAPGDRREER